MTRVGKLEDTGGKLVQPELSDVYCLMRDKTRVVNYIGLETIVNIV